jgi:hypothetical protein
VRCPADHGCEHACTPHLTGYTCSCPPGRMLTGKACVAAGAGEWRRAEGCEGCGAEGDGEGGERAEAASVCANRISSVDYECVCRPGYKMVEGRCVGESVLDIQLTLLVNKARRWEWLLVLLEIMPFTLFYFTLPYSTLFYFI